MFGSILGAIGSVVGGLFGKSAQDKQMEMQKQYAQNRVQWTAADARKAGIHPLAALGGAGAPSYTPIGGNPIGQGIAAGAAQLGKGTDPVSKSVISVNEAQADLLRAQALSVTGEMAANVRAGTTGARNVSDPTKPTGLAVHLNAADDRIHQSFSDLGAMGAKPSFSAVQGADGRIHFREDNPEGMEEGIFAAIREGRGWQFLTDLVDRNISGWKRTAVKRYLLEHQEQIKKGGKFREQAIRDLRRLFAN